MRTPRAAAYSTGQERLTAGLQAKLEDLYNWHYKNRQRRIGGWPDDHVGMAPCTVHCMAMRTPRATRAWCIAHRIPNPYDWAMARTRTRGNNRRPAVIRMHGSPKRGGHIPCRPRRVPPIRASLSYPGTLDWRRGELRESSSGSNRRPAAFRELVCAVAPLARRGPS